MDNKSTQTQAGLGQSIDPRDIVTRQLLERSLRGELQRRADVQAVRDVPVLRRSASDLRNTGGTSTALVDSPFFTPLGATGITGGRHYNAPYIDSTDPKIATIARWRAACPTSSRGRAPAAMTSRRAASSGTLDNVGGNFLAVLDRLHLQRRLRLQNGKPVYDGQGRLIPIFVPRQTYIDNLPSDRAARGSMSIPACST